MNEMELKFYTTLVRCIATVLLGLIFSIAGYSIADRIELGHVGYTTTLVPTVH